MLCLHLSGFKSPNVVDDGLLHDKFTLGRAEFWTGFSKMFFLFCFVSSFGGKPSVQMGSAGITEQWTV